MMLTKRGPMFLSDTAINIDPTADDLAKIAIMTAKTVKMFGVEPVMAMVSFSNFFHRSKCIKSKRGCSLFTQNHPEMVIDGVQADFALNPEMLKVSVF
jgi:malate dehydrogenase (oxaloacetate-decarboxylating)(NADP+)